MLTIDRIYEITDMLEHQAHNELQKATSFHNGYVKACEDFGRALRDEIYNDKNEGK
ncbi:hypothetical protein [Claveliimonas bilis]|uniref:hypothetical protein n=1 Tax=Claveliimonas bilis TaxID=3028070 RepID=UPI00292F44E9|nr:hypothetical protein [Claveliimonas bilis]BDZ80507.1 hypothetical protein Lac3_17160 [Claveliimonas bilis]